MKKLIILTFIFISLFIVINTDLSAEETIKVIVDGRGNNLDEALENAFQNAVRKATETLIISEQKIKNRTLYEDKIIVQSRGYIKTYDEIYKSIDNKEIRISAIVLYRKLESTLIQDDIVYPEVFEKGIKSLDWSMQELEDNIEFTNTLRGSDSTFFNRAYNISIVGYETKVFNVKKIDGYYLVKISLNKGFWNDWGASLKSVSGSGKGINGLLVGCKEVDNIYLVPSEVEEPPSFFLFNEHNYGVTINRNIIKFHSGSVHSVVDFNKSLTISFVTGNLNCYTAGDSAGYHSYTVFSDSITLKVPFYRLKIEDIKNTVLKQELPFSISVTTNEIPLSNHLTVKSILKKGQSFPELIDDFVRTVAMLVLVMALGAGL